MNDARKIRCHPALEEFARERFTADEWELDPSMPPNKIQVVPFAYAENIRMTIGFVNPDAAPKVDPEPHDG